MDVSIINVFSEGNLIGNSAGVCMVNHFLDDALMLKISAEVNLSETAFVVDNGNNLFSIRYFSPFVEVDFCGHATIASAYYVAQLMNRNTISFQTKGGKVLDMEIKDTIVSMNFKAEPYKVFENPVLLYNEIINKSPIDAVIGIENNDLLVIIDEDEQIETFAVNQEELLKQDFRGVIVSKKSKSGIYDFEVRYFAPKLGIKEDPVTGSIYSLLCLYWSKKLRKNKFVSIHKSKEGGVVQSVITGDHVVISGNVITSGSVRIQI